MSSEINGQFSSGKTTNICSVITRYQFSAVLNEAIAVIGLDKKLHKSHSFRTVIFYEEIKISSRWKSSAF